jgi:1,4-alpha-glucan branching enzyme
MKKRILTDFDLHLIAEGTHYKIYEKLGAHVMELDGKKGVHFAVWAPNAKKVSVIGDFNNWDHKKNPLKPIGDSGIWETFVPGIEEGELYKFYIESKYRKYKEQKADPFAFYFEVRPKSAAIIYNIEGKHQWQDQEWIEQRKKKNWLESPMAIYEVHLGSWMRGENNRFLSYRELAEKLILYVKDLGFTHIELLPITEHPLDASWGYQTIGYFAPTSRFGKPEDFMYFVDQCHQNGIGVIMDWVPAHFPKDAHGLGFFDGTCLYEHEDPRKGEHRDWGTLIFNYGRNEVRNFLISNALFWIEKYHIDGLRVDAVASMLYLDYSRAPGEWIPNIYGGNENLEAIDFLKKFNEIVHGYHQGVLTIAEESTAWPMVSRPTYLGGLGFSMKWNMGWMHDTLEYFSKDPIFRKYHTNNLTFSLLYAFTENFILPFSHDEVVHGKRSMLDKMPGDIWQKFANLRALYGYMYGHPGKKLLFMGSEFGQWREWKFDESLDWHLLDYNSHKGLQRFVIDLNRIYKSEPALYELDFDWHGFEWIDFHDSENSIISFIRRAKNPEDFLVFVFNLTPVPRFSYRIGVPRADFYKEILNSDSKFYWGSNLGNTGGLVAENIPAHGRPFSLNLTLPPLSVLILKPV